MTEDKMRVHIIQETLDNTIPSSGKVSELIKDLQNIVDRAPEEFRSEVEYDFYSTRDYDTDSVEIEVSYLRPATPEEIQARKDLHTRVAQASINNAKRAYERAVEDAKKAGIQFP